MQSRNLRSSLITVVFTLATSSIRICCLPLLFLFMPPSLAAVIDPKDSFISNNLRVNGFLKSFNSKSYAVDFDSISDTTSIKQMSNAQRKSFNLLINKYSDCFYTQVDTVTNTLHPKSAYKLPIEYIITFYEKHNVSCGGDPNTMPRHSSYSIDKYGRLFKENIVTASLDLQFQFNEDATFITDTHPFNHPTHTIFKRHNVQLNKVEKRAKNSFVIFYVSELNEAALEGLFNELLGANGDWDFIIRTQQGTEYYIEGHKRKIIDMESYR